MTRKDRSMKIIISPAKKMKDSPDVMPVVQLPEFLDSAQTLLEWLRGLSFPELKKLLACNDQIARLNYDRFQHMELRHGLTPAILAYEGIQYQYMAPSVFTEAQFAYVVRHLRILSGFYGVLRPLDGVTPYRLEMQAKLKTDFCENLYDFWKERLCEQLLMEEGSEQSASACGSRTGTAVSENADTGVKAANGSAPAAAGTKTACGSAADAVVKAAAGPDASPVPVILNLASDEYAKAVRPFISDSARFITPIFCEYKDGKLKEKGVYVKMARGEMVRYMAEHAVEEPEAIKGFDRLGYRFAPEESDELRYVFIKEAKQTIKRKNRSHSRKAGTK